MAVVTYCSWRGGFGCLAVHLTVRHERIETPGRSRSAKIRLQNQGFRVSSAPDDPITFTSTLEARRETVYFLARLIREHCTVVGTRRGTRRLSPFRQAVMVLRWFLDGTRIRQLAADNTVGTSTAYTRLHEAIDLLAALAPDVHEALAAAKAAEVTHLNLDGTLIRTDHVAMRGPDGADLWWSGKHKRHGGNIQVLSDPDGFPVWVSQVRPGREHDTTRAKAAEHLLPALEEFEGEEGIPTLTDLGYEHLSPALRHPHKKPKGRELDRGADDVQQGHPRRARRVRARQRLAKGDFRRAPDGQPEPDPHRCDRESGPRPAPPRTRPATARRLHEVAITLLGKTQCAAAPSRW